jgi:hypothetical protein
VSDFASSVHGFACLSTVKSALPKEKLLSSPFLSVLAFGLVDSLQYRYAAADLDRFFLWPER